MTDRITAGPRRAIRILAQIDADDWHSVESTLRGILLEIMTSGSLSKSSVSGGYSAGHIIITSEEPITHDAWAIELERYLAEMSATP